MILIFKLNVRIFWTNTRSNNTSLHLTAHRPMGRLKQPIRMSRSSSQKWLKNYKDWPLKLHFSLWGYRTSIRTSTRATPFSMVYGIVAVQPNELEIPSLQIVLESKLPEAKWVWARYDALVLLDEKRLKALSHVQIYQKRIERHSKNVSKGETSKKVTWFSRH